MRFRHKGNIIIILLAILLSGYFISGCKHEPLTVIETPVDTTGTGTDTTDNNNGGGNGGGGTGGGNNSDPCDPDSVYFEKDILPILISNCAMPGCHDAASHEDGVILDSYANVMSTGDIKPFDPGDSEIFEKITETDWDDKMPPPPNDPLTEEQVSLIAKWIMQGALNITCDESGEGCDTSDVTYSGVVAPIIQMYCSGCHSATVASGGINLSVYGGVASVATDGSLVGAITHSLGFTAMPLGGNKLPDCEIAQITAWVNDGAPNN